MTPTQITMQIVKNLGNYETCRLEATFTLDEKDDLTQSFATARKQLEKAFETAYGIKPKLTVKSARFESICKALYDDRATLEQVEKLFEISDEAMTYFKKHNLI